MVVTQKLRQQESAFTSYMPNKSLKVRSLRSLDSLNRRMLRILRAACVCPLALR
jgi:hypothetical protein